MKKLETFGPKNCMDAFHLIKEEVLYKNNPDVYGATGVLISIHPELSYPFKLRVYSQPFPRTLNAKFIVEVPR
jgi:hypothetical protein